MVIGPDAAEVLLLVSTTSYRLDDFRVAAERRGVRLLIGTDRCHELAQRWPEEAFGSLALDFRDLDAALASIVARAARRRLSAIIPTDELTAVLAARAAAALGLPGNAPAAAAIARSKARLRQTLSAAGLSCPGPIQLFSVQDDPGRAAAQLSYPCVLKPLLLSGSRGVIRADDPRGFVTAFERVAALLSRPELLAVGGEEGRLILVEPFIAGAEVALEGLLVSGRFYTLALFDKPDPLDGPYFEETIYVTPSRHPPARTAQIAELVGRAAQAMGLSEGAVHAELRLSDRGPVLLEVAARSIGGLCARALRFGLGDRALEELIIDAALGAFDGAPVLRGASGVLDRSRRRGPACSSRWPASTPRARCRSSKMW